MFCHYKLYYNKHFCVSMQDNYWEVFIHMALDISKRDQVALQNSTPHIIQSSRNVSVNVYFNSSLSLEHVSSSLSPEL